MDFADLEKQIERKISDLEREKTNLKEDLKVVRQASIIATDFEKAYSESNGKQDEYVEAPKAMPEY